LSVGRLLNADRRAAIRPEARRLAAKIHGGVAITISRNHETV